MPFIPQIELLNTLFVFMTLLSHLTKKPLFYYELFPTHFKTRHAFTLFETLKCTLFPEILTQFTRPDDLIVGCPVLVQLTCFIN